ncbi:hypothetical protein ACJJH9_00060 (plasmid) [Microbulbifer sp. DLAB2-AF]|uniref:hypothetical protein n=1 Tax=Microbulbifer sp. DLAB2-AF TaxID=3243395 RepID=UPI00403966FA
MDVAEHFRNASKTKEAMLRDILLAISTRPLLLSIFAFFIPAIGFALSFFGWSSAFPRSGAVMVCFALTCALIAHWSEKIENRYSIWRKATLKYVQPFQVTRENIPPGIAKENEITDELVAELQAEADRQAREGRQGLEKAQSEYIEKARKLKQTRGNVAIVEFITGIIGTLIWGFGDLFF